MATSIIPFCNSNLDPDDIVVESDNEQFGFCSHCVEHLVLLWDGTYGRYHSCDAPRIAEYELHMSELHREEERCYDEDIPF